MLLTVTKRRVLATLVSLAMIAAILATAASESEAAHPAVVDVGTLDLILDEATNVDMLFFDALAGPGSDLTDNIGTQGACNLTENGPNNPATFSAGPPGATVGKKKTGHEIGVRFNEGNGEPCARINDSGPLGQTLTLSLDGSLTGFKMDGGNVALRLKFGATAKVELFDGATLVGTFMAVCTGSDCGSDSGGDRVNVPIPADHDPHFDRVTISVASPADGATTLIDDPGFDTWFNVIEVFDGALQCEGTASEANGPTATFTRLTPEGDNTCEVTKLYRLAITAQIDFIPSAGVVGLYRGDLTFPNPPTNQLSALLEYDKDGPGPGGFVDAQWCDTRTAVGAEIGDFPELNGGNDFPDLTTMSNDSDGLAPTSCIVAFSQTTDGPEEWVIFLTGDPFYK